MSFHMPFWLEVRRAIARWTGVILASVLSGLLLGALRRQGMAYRSALEWALTLGFILALLFWIWISSQFSGVSVARPAPVSPDAVNFEGQSATTRAFQCTVFTETSAAA
jgi:urea transporter